MTAPGFPTLRRRFDRIVSIAPGVGRFDEKTKALRQPRLFEPYRGRFEEELKACRMLVSMSTAVSIISKNTKATRCWCNGILLHGPETVTRRTSIRPGTIYAQEQIGRSKPIYLVTAAEKDSNFILLTFLPSRKKKLQTKSK